MSPEERGVDRTARPSLLDRLIDLHPNETSDAIVSLEESIDEFRASVLRDIEWLLNARRTIVPIPDGLKEVRASVLTYGLPDLTSIATDTPEARSGIVRRIEETLRLFEPRMSGIRVSVAETPDNRKQLRFIIGGVLDMEPEPERVVFDTVVELARGDFTVDQGP